jgi:hypothetical protein
MHAVSTGSALIRFRRHEDLQRLAIFADHANAIPRHSGTKQMREPVGAGEAHAHLQHGVSVVLGLQLPDSAHAAERELEPMPVVGRGEWCHNEISLAGPRRRSRGWDRRLDAFVDGWDRRRPLHGARIGRRCRRTWTFFTRSSARSLAWALLRTTWWERCVEPRGRRRRCSLRRRGGLRWRLGTCADPGREIDGALLVLLVLFVLLRHR